MKSTLKTGLITAIISCVCMFGFFSLMIWLNTKNNWGISASTIRGIGALLSIPIQAIGIYIAMQNVKKLNGMLNYGQALKTGLTVAITIAIVVAVFGFVYTRFINPDFANYMVKDAQRVMIASGESQQQINQDSAKVAQQFTPAMQAVEGTIGQFVTGLVISLIIGLFIKTKNAA